MFFSRVSGQTQLKIDRDEFLSMNNDDLLRQCRIESFVGSGPGGQHRNRNYTAVRLIVKELPQFICEASDSRSQKQNISEALQKLRIKMAVQWRKTPPETASYNHLNENNPGFACEFAKLLDMLCECGFDHKETALRLGISNSKLLKELCRIPEVWNNFQSIRAEKNLPELKIPR